MKPQRKRQKNITTDHRTSLLPHLRVSPFDTRTRLTPSRVSVLPVHWTSERKTLNAIYAGDIIALRKTAPIGTPQVNRTYVSTGLALGSNSGVFANMYIKGGDIVCYFAGTLHTDTYSKHGEYAETLPDGRVVDPIDMKGNILEDGKTHSQIISRRKVHNVLVHGARINEPVDVIRNLSEDAKLQFKGNIAKFVGQRNTTLTESHRQELMDVSLYPNVYINGTTATQAVLEAEDRKDSLIYLPVVALRGIAKNEEILMCYGSGYAPIRDALGYTASDCRMADFDFGAGSILAE